MNDEREPSPPVTPAAAREQRRQAAARRPLGRPVLYPNIYVWYVFFAALDIMFTWIVLHFDGHEANWLARWVLELGGLPAMTVYKFVLVMLVICVCEVIGRRHRILGRKVAKWAVALNALPVALAVVQLLLEVFVGQNH